MTDSATQKRLKFLNRQQPKFSTPDALALFALGTFGLHLLTFFLLVLLYGAYSTLSKKAPPSLVQLQDGKSIKAIPLGSRERSPQVVTRFVNDTMTLMMNASGTFPATTPEEAREPKRDPGIDIRAVGNGRGKVTTAAWQASTALSEDFRKEFLKLLADTTPQGVFKGTTQIVLTPLSIQPPVKIASGKWKVKMVANLTVFDRGNNLGEVIPFNKEIFVQAVEAPSPPVQMTGLTAVIYGVRSSGLEIYAIRQPIVDDEGYEVMPAGSEIVCTVQGVHKSAASTVQATRLVVDGREYVLPKGAITITGKGGHPLMASRYIDKGGEIASRDATTFIFGSLAKVGKVLNEPDETSSFASVGIGGSTSTTSIKRRKPNLLGAVLEGGFTPLTQQILARNQAALAEISKREDVWYVRAGTDVQVVVNQSFEL